MKSTIASVFLALAATTVSATPLLEACDGPSSECFVARGNDIGNAKTVAETITLLTANFGGTGWRLLGVSDDRNGPFAAHVDDTRSGTLDFTPLVGNFALTLKAGNGFTAYSLTGPATGLRQVSFSISRDLSHSSLWVNHSTTTVTAVPEPTTYALMLAGLGAIGFVSLRRKAK